MPCLQREVQRLLGRCLLRLQQYERLLKALVAHHELAGPMQVESTGEVDFADVVAAVKEAGDYEVALP